MLSIFAQPPLLSCRNYLPWQAGNDGNMAPTTEYSNLALCHFGTRALVKIQEILTHRLAPDLNAKAPGRKGWTKMP
jgi:hypothetical protein